MEPYVHCAAGFITYRIRMSKRRPEDIAKAIDYSFYKKNKEGAAQYDLPLQKVGPLAVELDIHPMYLLRMVMEEYYPETFKEIAYYLKGLELTEEEVAVVNAYRDITKSNRNEELVAVIMKERNEENN